MFFFIVLLLIASSNNSMELKKKYKARKHNRVSKLLSDQLSSNAKANALVDNLQQRLTQTDVEDKKIIESKALLYIYKLLLNGIYCYFKRNDCGCRIQIDLPKEEEIILKKIMINTDDIKNDYQLKKTNSPFNELLATTLKIQPPHCTQHFEKFDLTIPFINVSMNLNVKEKKITEKDKINLNMLLNDFYHLFNNYHLQKIPVKYLVNILNYIMIEQSAVATQKNDERIDKITKQIHNAMRPIVNCLAHLPEERLISKQSFVADLLSFSSLIAHTSEYEFFTKNIKYEKISND